MRHRKRGSISWKTLQNVSESVRKLRNTFLLTPCWCNEILFRYCSECDVDSCRLWMDPVSILIRNVRMTCDHKCLTIIYRRDIPDALTWRVHRGIVSLVDGLATLKTRVQTSLAPVHTILPCCCEKSHRWPRSNLINGCRQQKRETGLKHERHACKRRRPGSKQTRPTERNVPTVRVAHVRWSIGSVKVNRIKKED
jgi:hypothetical protein